MSAPVNQTAPAIVNTGPMRLEWQRLPIPVPAAGEVRIATAACGICATDLEMIAGWERTGFPAIPGHEWAGMIDAVGTGVDPALAGQPCVADNILPDGSEVGFERPGGYARHFCTAAENLCLLPPRFPLHHAVLIEPLAVCVHAVRRLGAETIHSALIIGDGPIGLLLAALLSGKGISNVELIGGRQGRLKVARQLGCRSAWNYHELPQAGNAIFEQLGRGPFDVVFEASGSKQAAAWALELAAMGGRIVIVGDYGNARADFAWNTLLHRELSLIGSNTGTGAWEDAVDVAVSGRIPLEKLITHRLPADQFEQGMELVRNRDTGAIKVVLEWN